jgi:hypothetical protein
MFKQILILIVFALAVRSYAQVSPEYAIEVDSDGLVPIANINCGDGPCIPEGESFLLPFSVVVNTDMDDVYLDRMEIYLLGILNESFGDKVGAVRTGGSIKLFGLETNKFPTQTNDTDLLFLNLAKTEFIAEVKLDDKGKKRLEFMLHGSFGVAKAKNVATQLTQDEIDNIQDTLNLQMQDTSINNGFGAATKMGGAISLQLSRITLTGYADIMVTKTNSIFGGNYNYQGFNNHHNFNSFNTGIELEVNIFDNNKGRLSIFSGIDYGSYNYSATSKFDHRNGNVSTISMPNKGYKELLFTTGLRFTLPSFRR